MPRKRKEEDENNADTTPPKWSSTYDGFQDVKPNGRVRLPPLRDSAGRIIPKIASTDKPLRRFEENIDKEKLSLFMSERESDKYQAFVLALHDPDHARLSFATICRKFGVTLNELQAIYTDGMRHLGMLQMANALPQVMQDVSEDALNTTTVCPRCDGLKQLPITLRDEEGNDVDSVRECPQCEGIGKVKERGDKHARDLVFESMKLTNAKVPLVGIVQNFGGSDGMDAKMEGMLKMTQGITMGSTSTNADKSDPA